MKCFVCAFVFNALSKISDFYKCLQLFSLLLILSAGQNPIILTWCLSCNEIEYLFLNVSSAQLQWFLLHYVAWLYGVR